MVSRPPRSLAAASLVVSAGLWCPPAQAVKPYVVIEDPEGAVAEPDETPGVSAWRGRLLDAYAATGSPLPEVLSVWTTFPMSGTNYATFIDPRANAVEGINLPLKESTTPPLLAVLWHNNVHVMQARADLHRAPLEGYARYLFLLELSHLWGPELAAPAPGASDLIGFPYHWSFFLDLAGPAGGNAWTDNGDGTFTIVPGDPATVAFSPLDLYIMGLAEPDEVAPFGVLTNAVVPATPTDPCGGGTYAARSFPWFDVESPPLTVTATRRALTIDEIIAANGPRIPAAGTKTSWTIGFVLMVDQDADAAAIAEAEAAFRPIAESLAPAFQEATMGRGTLEVVTQVEEGDGGGGGAGGGSPTGAGPASSGSGDGGDPAGDDGGGCDCRAGARRTASRPRASWGALAGALALLFVRAKRRSLDARPGA